MYIKYIQNSFSFIATNNC